MKKFISGNSIGLIIKSNPWVSGLIAIGIYLLVSVWYNAVSGVEAQTLLSYKLIFNGLNITKFSEIPSSPLVPLIFAGGDLIGGVIGARIVSVLFGIAALFFFYKFVFILVKNRDSAFYSMILLGISAPFIFIGKSASWSIISFAFFTAFLYYNQRKYENSTNSLVGNLLISFFLLLAVSSNYILLVYLPFLVLGAFFSNKRNLYILPVLIFMVMLICYTLIFSQSVGKFIESFLFSWHNEIKLKAIISVIQHLIIPFMLLGAMFFERSKYYFSNKLYSIFFGMAFVLPIIQLPSGNNFITSGNLAFSVLFLAALTGVMLKDYISRHANTKYAVIIVLFLSCFLSLYQVKLFETSYPDLKEASKKMKMNTGLNSLIIGENTDVLKYYLYPEVLPTQFADIKQLKENPESIKRDRQILETIINGKADIICITELVNPELAERIRDAINIKFYSTLFTEEYKISTLFYPVSEGKISVYKLK